VGELLQLHPSHVTDRSTMARLGRIGLQPGERFDYDALYLKRAIVLDRGYLRRYSPTPEIPTHARL
jgi:hypothetical protein